MANQDIMTDDYVAALLAKDAKDCSIKYSAMGLNAFTQSSKPPANKPKPNTRFLRNIIKDTDSHNAALLAKEAAESRARLESLASNEYRDEKASRLGGGDIRRRQLGDIASILEGRPPKRKRAEDTKREHKESRRVNTSIKDEVPPVKKVHDDKSRSRRQLGDIAAILGGSPTKSRRTDDQKEKHSRRQSTSSEDNEPKKYDETRSRFRRDDGREEWEKSKCRRDQDDPDDRQRRRDRGEQKRRRSVSEDHEKSSDRKRRRWEASEERGRDGYEKRRSRSPREHREGDTRHGDRSPNHKRNISRSPKTDRKKSDRLRRHKRSLSPQKRSIRDDTRASRKEESKRDYDSDPLDDIIGPRPPPVPEVRPRGRGAVSHGSGMDSRFSASYDPTADVQLDPDEENDWDQALEALRDRQKWKQQGADRLRAAGFTDDEINKWEKGGEKREEDVKWAKKGESREWDRGKVIDDDGTISSEPSWGRLKDT